MRLIKLYKLSSKRLHTIIITRIWNKHSLAIQSGVIHFFKRNEVLVVVRVDVVSLSFLRFA